MRYENTETLKMRANGLLNQIKEADARYWSWHRKGCYKLASMYKEKLEQLFTELADVNISFIKNETTEHLNRISTCVILSEMGIPYTEADGMIYLNG